MAAIPQVLPSDPEDVVWALQTAETLWKRDERSDAIVWLRRAAQAAGEAELDERALELSKLAAELSDQLKNPGESVEIDVLAEEPSAPAAVAQQPAPAAAVPAPVASPAAPPVAQAPSFPKPAPRPGQPPPVPKGPPPLPPRARPPAAKPAPPAIPMDAVPPPPLGVPGSTPPPPQVAAYVAPAVAPPNVTPNDAGPARRDSGAFAVLPSTGARMETVAMPEEPPSVDLRQSLAPMSVGEDEIVTVPPAGLSPTKEATTEAAIRRNPSLTDIDAMAGLVPPPVRAPAPTRNPADEPGSIAPTAQEPELLAQEPHPAAHEPEPAEQEQASRPVDESPVEDAPRESITPRVTLSIDDYEAFADLPDDLRETLQKSAFVMSLKEGGEIPSFALAIVLAGDVDVAAHGVDAPAVRLPTGHVLYGRGSIDSDVPMRLLGTGTGTEVAVWSRDDVGPIMKSCSWVEDDLRASADPVLAAVGVTIGTFGARLDPTLRGIVTARLAVHSLGPGDVLFPAGKIVPGLFVVGAGEIELVMGGNVTSKLGPGDFIFPGAVVGGSNKAAAEARSGQTGALVLSCDRKAAQELLMTCPPLLEILATL
jgi:hypothetical protein